MQNRVQHSLAAEKAANAQIIAEFHHVFHLFVRFREQQMRNRRTRRLESFIYLQLSAYRRATRLLYAPNDSLQFSARGSRDIESTFR